MTLKYWLTPPDLAHEVAGRFDPTPWPRRVDWDALTEPWPKPWYLNPPFSQAAAFTRKALAEGGPGTIIVPTTTPTQLLIEAEARIESLGRVRWLDCETKAPMPVSRAPPCILARLE